MHTDTLIAFPADTHSGSPVGLLPPGQWAFTNGGYHDPDAAQRVLTKLWDSAWERVARQRRGKRLIIVHVGDAVEGSHHATTELLTPRVDEHERIHLAAMERALKIVNFNPKGGDQLYYVKGTPAHVGPGGASEERIARDFAGQGIVARIPPTSEDGQDGRYLWDRLRLEVNGRLFDIAHHGASVGTKPWTKTNALRSKLQEIYFRAIEAGERIPDVWLRADRHQRAYDVFVSSRGTRIEGFVTPAFQGKTEYGYKVAADRPASLGLLFFEVSAAGVFQPFWELLEMDPDEVMKV